jgi:nitrate reductase cytochrome c-type subunit
MVSITHFMDRDGQFLASVSPRRFFEKTCIDCHKGVAHRLPDMRGVPGWQ